MFIDQPTLPSESEHDVILDDTKDSTPPAHTDDESVKVIVTPEIPSTHIFTD